MNALAIAVVVWVDWMRRKDVYVFLVMLVAILFAVTSVDAFGLRGVALYGLDVALLLAWLFGWLLAVNAGSRELPQEESRGTVFLLLAKPMTRADLVIGKWIGAWTSVACAVALFYVAGSAVAWLRGVRFDAVVMVQALLLHAVALAILTALAVACSTRLNRDAAATLSGTISVAAFLLAHRIPELALHSRGWQGDALLVLYYVLPHLELFDIRQRVVHGFGPVGTATTASVILYGIALTATLLLAAWLAYRGKRFSRGALAE